MQMWQSLYNCSLQTLKALAITLAVLSAINSAWLSASAQSTPEPAPAARKATPLEGRVEEEDFRIRKPPAQEKMRIGRPTDPALGSSPVDSHAFANPLAGKADNTQLNGNAVQSGDFANLPKGFDIGADKGSKELVLAWEKWHKQLAAAIYQVWNGRAKSPGRAILKITVYRNKIMVPEILSCKGNSEFRASIMSVFSDLNGNPGLTFPAKSERQQVSFEAEYIAGTNVDPGYSWLKGDYEKIHKDY
jgi:hypothetical protein